MRYPPHLLKLMAVLKKLPGVGNKSAERFAFQMMDWPEEKLKEMSQVIGDVKKNLKKCTSCGALLLKETCELCDLNLRQHQQLCVVASAKDVFLIEETKEYRGLYHVLDGLLSPFQGKNLDFALIEKIKERIVTLKVEEVILAFDFTIEGDATALFLKRELAPFKLTLSRLAFGIPIGSSFDYIDGGTLGKAFKGRQTFPSIP